MDGKFTQAKVAIAHLGARKHYQEPILFHQWGILDTFYTDFYARNSSFFSLLRSKLIYSRLPKPIKKMADRYAPELDGARVIDFPLWGIQYPIKLSKASSSQEVDEIHISTGKEFNQKIISTGLGDANIIYGFNSACLEVFQFAKNNGIRCILDQTLAVKSLEIQLLEEEEQRWPGWSKSPFTTNSAMIAKLNRERQEQELADHIVCGSEFVKQSLIETGIAANKISVVSLGKSNTKNSSLGLSNTELKRESNNPLKILFAGSVCLRKGVPYLLETLALLEDKIPFVCKLAGDITLNEEKLQKYGNVCEFLGRVPRSEMDRLYRWADVFVLPSVCEGSAMVTYEAMIYGLPIITTYNTGSIVRDGIDGFIVPIRDPQAIVDSLLNIHHSLAKFNDNQDRADYLKLNNENAKNTLKHLLESFN
ncbi:MAG: glycosyltransferase family 4 protein [Snowella sp.]|nr:glycosyltransferase family 4 protein [Snowella sp.]